jgi:site-specific DNA-methyltransferase (adenine-specific)
MDNWGFIYKTFAFTWIKLNKSCDKMFFTKKDIFFGIGHWTASNAEVCIAGLTPKGILNRQSKFISQIVLSPRKEHSRKPDEVRNKIVELCGDLPRIELFARQKTEGWDVWGNEVESAH